MKRLAYIISMGFLIIVFQNCSNVSYEQDPTSASKTMGSGSETPISPGEEIDQTEYLNEIVASNPACAMEARVLNFRAKVDLQGQNFGGNTEGSWNQKLYENGTSVSFNGGDLSLVGVRNSTGARFNGSGYGTVLVENVKNISFNGGYHEIIVRSPEGNVSPVNGNSQKLYVEANAITVNGVHNNLCVKAKDISVNGVYGTGGAPTILMGNGPESTLRTLNGQRQDVLVHQLKISVINGGQRDIYISNSVVDVLNGTADEVYIFNKSKIKSVNGQYRRIYLFNGSSIDKLNGEYQLIQTTLEGMPVQMLSL